MNLEQWVELLRRELIGKARGSATKRTAPSGHLPLGQRAQDSRGWRACRLTSRVQTLFYRLPAAARPRSVSFHVAYSLALDIRLVAQAQRNNNSGFCPSGFPIAFRRSLSINFSEQFHPQRFSNSGAISLSSAAASRNLLKTCNKPRSHLPRAPPAVSGGFSTPGNASFPPSP